MTVWINVTSSYSWSGNPVGIVRVERELASRFQARFFVIENHILKEVPNLVVSNSDGIKRHHTPDQESGNNTYLRARNFLINSLQRNRSRRIALAVSYAVSSVYGVNKQVDKLILKSILKITSMASLYKYLKKILAKISYSDTTANIVADSKTENYVRSDVLLENIPFNNGDIVLSMGLDWDSGVLDILESIKASIDIKVISTVYDLIPITNPKYVVSSYYASALFGHFNTLARVSDLVLINSDHVRQQFTEFCSGIGIKVPPLEIVAWGSNRSESQNVNFSFQDRFMNSFLLVVGTLEVRKNHKVLLQVIEIAKKNEINLPQIVFVGRAGWGTYDLQQELMSIYHDTSAVTWIQDATDEELSWLYSNCEGVLSPSFDEGYGLPVLEAMSFGKRVLLSDIPIYRELFPDSLFADPYNPNEWLIGIRELKRLGMTAPVKQVDWNSAVHDIAIRIRNNGFQQVNTRSEGV